jgi:hypothetical protein
MRLEESHGGESPVTDQRDVVFRIRRTPELARIRDQQRIFLNANQKFPDFIEIGIGIWENLLDWHVRHQQPLSVARNAEGRYTMAVAFSTLVLRSEMAENYVGIGMDSR